MRHDLARAMTIAIATFLLAGAGLFAWLRSSQLAVTDEWELAARYEPSPEFEWQVLGASSFERNCSNCHGRTGLGWDQYPPLGHAASLTVAAGGREYLLDVHIYGLSSDRYGVPMPPMGHIPDAELAAVVNHVLRNFGNERLAEFAPLYAPADVRARRGQGLSPRDVNARRPGAQENP
jgi:mono/diheme cytochrome c family protein